MPNDGPFVEIKRKRSIGNWEDLTQDEQILLLKFSKKTAASHGYGNAKITVNHVDKAKIDGVYYKARVTFDKFPLVKICTLIVHTEDDLSNPSLVKSNCNAKRTRRSNNIPGGIVDKKKDDPEVKQFLNEGLLHLDSQSPHKNRYKIKEILSASTQVVSGTLLRVKAKVIVSDCEKGNNGNVDECGELEGATGKVCNFKIWNRPWLPKGRETNIKCEEEEQTYSFRTRRDIQETPTGDYKRTRRGIKGGVKDLEKDDQRVKESLTEGLLHLDSQSPHEHRYKIKEILGASTQVVAGTLLRIKAKMVGRQARSAISKFGTKPWLENGKETNITCENDEQTYSFRSGNKRASRSVKLGGIGDIQKDDPQVKGFLNDGLLHLDSHSPHKNRYKIKEILSATTQSVSGTLFRVKAKVVVSDCEKGHDGNLDKCGELEGATSKVCNFEIWNQPWLEKGRETNIQCEDERKTYSFRMRRDLQDVKEDSSFEDEELQFLFKSFTKVYGKTYMNEMEYNFRQQVLKENLNTIRMLNKFEQGSATYGLSRFADLTQEEFSNMHGLRMDLRNQNDVPFARADIPDIEIPTEFDWRKKNAVSEVKDQGQCGSCWAFSAIGNIEGQYAIKYKKLQQFSEQELVDCDKLDEGCNGGLMDNAYSTIERIGGLESETDYPYKAEDEKCLFKKSKVKVQLSGAVNISHDETDMAKWLVQNGPIAIALNANAMQFYMGGVSHPWKFLCSPASLDHGVLIVGYGVDNFPKFNKTLPYWIVKNSWGKSWGEQGYYRVYRGDGTCGLNQTPSSGIVA
ncbi:hypothetical protein JTB14_023810 [Gonioctena quinquepunctata]|nr:hypothetical protein JTB14_023810 [Gonioctena quinquepunctata]